MFRTRRNISANVKSLGKLYKVKKCQEMEKKMPTTETIGSFSPGKTIKIYTNCVLHENVLKKFIMSLWYKFQHCRANIFQIVRINFLTGV